MRAQYELGELRLGDLVAFLAVQRNGSLSAAARELHVTTSQISKAIARLEGHTRERLLSRGVRGVVLTEAGKRVTPHVVEAVARLRAVGPSALPRAPLPIALAAPSYLLAGVVPLLAQSPSSMRLRAVELPPAQIRALLAEDAFDIAVLPGHVERLPSSWEGHHVGALRKSLLGTAAAARALAPLPTSLERVRAARFIVPAARTGAQFAAIRDDCPLPESERRVAHEMPTIAIALELAASSDLVVFGPLLAARRHFECGRLVEIPVAGWDVREPVHVLSNADRITARVRSAVVHAARDVLAGQEAAAVEHAAS
jgi:DNA-binding transcriptional LysR family regulator